MMSLRWFSSIAIGACCVATSALAQDEAPTPEYRPAVKPEIIQLEDGRLDLGGVIVDPKERTATFPVELNDSNEGELIEYLLVNENGKTHESLLKTKIQPFHLHTAMLLLGIKRAGLPPPETPPENIDEAWLENAPMPTGAPVEIRVLVDGDSHRIESWIWDESRQKPMQPGEWTYNGSYFQGASFMAEVQGSFAGLVTDPIALLNVDDPQRVNDANWFINSKAETFPAADQSILFELTVAPPAVDPQAESNNVNSPKHHED